MFQNVQTYNIYGAQMAIYEAHNSIIFIVYRCQNGAFFIFLGFLHIHITGFFSVDGHIEMQVCYIEFKIFFEQFNVPLI